MNILSMFLRRATAMVRTEFCPHLVLSTCTKKGNTKKGINESGVRLLQANGDDSKAEDCPRRVPQVPYPAWLPRDCYVAVIVTVHSL